MRGIKTAATGLGEGQPKGTTVIKRVVADRNLCLSFTAYETSERPRKWICAPRPRLPAAAAAGCGRRRCADWIDWGGADRADVPPLDACDALTTAPFRYNRTWDGIGVVLLRYNRTATLQNMPPMHCDVHAAALGWVFLNGGDQPTAAAAGCKMRDPLTYGYGLWNILPSTSARGGGECPLTTGTGNSTDPAGRSGGNSVPYMAPHHRRKTCLRLVRTYYSVGGTLHFFSFRSTQVVAVAARSDTVRSRSRHGRGRRQPRETEPTRVSRPLATTSREVEVVGPGGLVPHAGVCVSPPPGLGPWWVEETVKKGATRSVDQPDQSVPWSMHPCHFQTVMRTLRSVLPFLTSHRADEEARQQPRGVGA